VLVTLAALYVLQDACVRRQPQRTPPEREHPDAQPEPQRAPAPARETTKTREAKPIPLRVLVVDATDGSPLANAEVRLCRNRNDVVTTARTGADGLCRLQRPADGRLDVWVACRGYVATRDSHYPCDVRDVHFALEAGLPIEGVVVEARTREPLEDARVRVGRETVWTDSAGRFRIGGVVAGEEFRIRADHEGFVPVERRARGRPGDASLVLVLGDGGVLEARVVDEADRPKAGATVYLLEENGEPLDCLETTDPAGNVRIRGIPLHRTFVAIAHTSDFRRCEGPPMSFEALGVVQRHLLVAKRCPYLVVRLVDPQGHPVPDNNLELDEQDFSERRGPGEYAFWPIDPGRHTLVTSPRGWSTQEFTVDVEPGGTEVTLETSAAGYAEWKKAVESPARSGPLDIVLRPAER